MLRYFLLIFSFIVLFSLLAAGQASSAGFRFDPILVERVARADEVVSYTINIDNEDQFNSITVEVSIADIAEDKRGLYQLRSPESTSYSLAPWAQVDTEKLKIPPGATRQIEVKVNVPRGVTGGLYGAVVLTLLPDKKQEDREALAGSQYYFQAASFIEIIIEGTALRQEAYADYFQVEPSSNIPLLRERVGDNALVFSLGVANEGNVHIVTWGTLLIQTAEGRTVGRYPLGGGRGVIIPNATVELRSIITQPLPPGDYRARAIIEYGGGRPIVTEVDFTVVEDKIVQEIKEENNLARFLVEPEEVDLQLRAGAFNVVVLELENRGTESINLTTEIAALEYDDYGDLIPSGKREAGPVWFEVTPGKISLDPGEKRRVRLSLRPPRNAAGAYYADIIFKSEDSGVHTESGVSVFAYVGTEIRKKGVMGITEIQETPEALELDLYFANEGSIHLQPQIQVVLNQLHPQMVAEDGQIIGPWSETVATVKLPATNPVLPETRRLFNFYIPTQLEPGDYELLIRADYGGDEPEILRLKFHVQGG